MTKDASDDWILLSNRLLLLQEIMVGFSQLPFAEVLTRAANGVSWIFSGSKLTSASPGALSPLPLIVRGRALLDDYGEVYLAYFEGPPEPSYLLLSGLSLNDPQEFRLAALYFEHLLAALSAAGYREELARQAQTDWLTGLGNRRSLLELLHIKPDRNAAVGLLEVLPPEPSTQATADVLLQKAAETLSAWLPRGRVLRVGAYRFALFGSENDVPEGELLVAEVQATQGWALQREVGGKALGALFEQAEVRLERALAARWSAELPLAQPTPGGESSVRVSCGLPAAVQLWQERAQSWPFKQEVTLLFDLPHGFALEALSGEPAPVLVVTDSPSEPYLYDLLRENPQGMIVGTPSEETLRDDLERVLQGETFYRGPALEEDGLYPRERTVLRQLARGSANGQIAKDLGISEKTVANYVTSLQDKLFLKNRVELVLYYLGKLERS